MLPTSTANVFELCANFLPGDDANGGPRFKIDPSGGWNDEVPAGDYKVSAGWVKISFTSTTKTITVQQNLAANCPGASSSSVAIVSSSSVSSSSVSSSSVKSSSVSSSSVAPSSSSVASSSVPAQAVTHNAEENCMTCHKASGTGAVAPVFTVAGTVLKTDGSPQNNATITFTEPGTNAIITLKTDASGNFYTQQAIAGIKTTGFTPTLTTPLGTKTMPRVNYSGACSSCHGKDDITLIAD